MTRLEENKECIDGIIKTTKCNPTITYEQKVTSQLIIIATILLDISKSLAVIADKADKGEKK